VMYLLIYRVPRPDDGDGRQGYHIVDESIVARNYRTSLPQASEFQIFGAEDSSGLKLDLANPSSKLQFTSGRFKAKTKKQRKGNPNKTRGYLKFNRISNQVSGSFDCRLLERMSTSDVLGMGYTKVVRRGVVDGKSFALKYTTSRNQDVIKCKSERPVERHFECFNLAKFKLLKEALLFSQLKHKNIIKVYGVCPWTANDVEGTESVLTVITELGTPLDIIRMLQIPWDQRLKISIDLVDLLIYLDDTSIGSLLIKDFRIEQLVLKDGTLKLTDLDDLDGRKKTCRTEYDCLIGGPTVNTTVPCKYQRCQGYSKTLNLYNFYKVFLDYSLYFDNPVWISEDLKAIAKRVAAFRISVQDLQTELNRVVWYIKSGMYEDKFIHAARNNTKMYSYEPFPDATIMGNNFDYYCLGSRSLTSCEMVVSNIEVAKVTCSMSSECKAIVVKQGSNWLGQRIVVFKNNGRSLTPVTKHKTFVKVE